MPITVSIGPFIREKRAFLKASELNRTRQHGPNVVIGSEILVFQHLYGSWVPGWGVHPRRHLSLVGYEVVVKVAGEESGRGRLLADYINDVLAVEIAGAAQESLFFVISWSSGL